MSAGPDLRSLIRPVPDFPRPGVQFRDITTLLKDAAGFRAVVDGLCAPWRGEAVDKVVGIESRGFIVGAAVASALGRGFVPIRKAGKLPAENFGQDYELEYGSDRLEMHRDAIERGERVLVVDDLIATGGTADAALKLVAMAGGDVAGCAFVVELPSLGGCSKLRGRGLRIVSLAVF
ncbi:MAG: adenine phosphoribosyltransferase [Burkholderiales bacterium]